MLEIKLKVSKHIKTMQTTYFLPVVLLSHKGRWRSSKFPDTLISSCIRILYLVILPSKRVHLLNATSFPCLFQLSDICPLSQTTQIQEFCQCISVDNTPIF